MNILHKLFLLPLFLIAAVTTCLETQLVQAQTLLDDFNNASTWTVPGASPYVYSGSIWGQYDQGYRYGRTQFGNPPTAVNESGLTYIRLPLDSYNPNENSLSTKVNLYGSEIGTHQQFYPQTPGTQVVWQARLRYRSAGSYDMRGSVGAMWGYGRHGDSEPLPPFGMSARSEGEGAIGSVGPGSNYHTYKGGSQSTTSGTSSSDPVAAFEPATFDPDTFDLDAFDPYAESGEDETMAQVSSTPFYKADETDIEYVIPEYSVSL